MNAPETPQVVDIAGAAKIIGTSIMFIRRRIADGSLKAFRLKGSRLIRIDVSDLETLKEPVIPSELKG
jgi:excisionase family DNA binding protein